MENNQSKINQEENFVEKLDLILKDLWFFCQKNKEEDESLENIMLMYAENDSLKKLKFFLLSLIIVFSESAYINVSAHKDVRNNLLKEFNKTKKEELFKKIIYIFKQNVKLEDINEDLNKNKKLLDLAYKNLEKRIN